MHCEKNTIDATCNLSHERCELIILLNFVLSSINIAGTEEGTEKTINGRWARIQQSTSQVSALN